ncbi:penicillin-binding transpeptidase domain-containing protein [Actinomadura gamaensis]|uniref:Penicillin-binding transpeptidase domain-containing protein n=1 Tax=Actinomadura gamaensis TaxID=1763541 RepID=A0ABV9TS15_9ACTN
MSSGGTNRALRWTWVITLLMVLALMANVTYVQGFEAQSLRDDPQNTRQYSNRDAIARGPIVAGGERIAWSDAVAKNKYQRRYKDSETFSPITGYFSMFSQTQLESSENHVLDGSDPRLKTTSLMDRILGRKVPGGTVETTINPRAQRAAYQALAGSGGRRAAAVALDPRTGAILVMASYPSYDANQVAVPNAKQAQAAFDRLNKDASKPLLSKATGEVFPPGSTFKTVVASSAMAAGTTKDTSVPAGRSYKPRGAGQPINNDAGDIGGECDNASIPLITAYAQSCNTTFAYMGAERPGNGGVSDQAARFGFYKKIEYDKGLSSAVSSFPKTGQPSLSALGSIGQGSTIATPLQMAMVAAAVVNDGKVMRPYLVARLRGADGTVVQGATRQSLGQALNADQAGQMRDLMREVVKSGTGKSLQGSSVGGGKTGTADIEGVSYNDRWFIGFGPGSSARYAVAVMTEAPGYGIESGPIAAKIIDALGG